MRISKLHFPKDYSRKDGLGSIEMGDLGQLVLLAGQNGSGKTRLLERVRRAYAEQPSDGVLASLRVRLGNQEEELGRVRAELKRLQDKTDFAEGERDGAIRNCEAQIRQHEEGISQTLAVIRKDVLRIEGTSESRQVVHFVPKKLELTDPKSLTETQREEKAARARAVDTIHEYPELGLALIQDIHIEYWNATHQNSQLSPEEKRGICEEYDRLQSTIRNLVGTELQNDRHGSATLFGFPIGKAQLSDGQRVLLLLAVAIHCQMSRLDEVIVFLDEPENHLHPGSIIDVIEKLLESIPHGQIWIATHSVSILAHFASRGSLWYMDKGEVRPAGKIQDKVLEGLLGNSDRIEKQLDFLEEPEQAAIIRYAQECLCPPSTLMTGPGDPQVAQIRTVINELYAKSGRIKILDYGAGKGRLLASLVADAENVSDIKDKLDYVALDSSHQDRKECEGHISGVFESADRRWFNGYHALLDEHNKGDFDVALLCNVLHEIDPKKWKGLFGAEGEITELLADDGHLLVIEDQRIPRGENAHRHGFIVLDTGSLKDLFCVQGDDPQFIADSQREGRLKAHLIPKNMLARFTTATLTKALQSHQKQAETEIHRLREATGTVDGRLFAFWTFQYTSATMALSDMT